MRALKQFFPLAGRQREPVEIDLLSRPECHLCDDAFDALVPVFGRDAIHIIDITQVPELEKEYVFRIPVVRFQGADIVEGQIDGTIARSARRKVNRIARKERSKA